jgi:aminoglycoside 3-N-acetyltransferase
VSVQERCFLLLFAFGKYKMMKILKREDIVEGLRQMGLCAGDEVMVHSSLSSMGYVEGGGESVIEAFLEVLGEEGTLMMPTFTHSNTEYFDPLTSPSKNGAVTEACRRHSRAVRSLHPTHAVTVIGPDTEVLVMDDLECGALGRGCALHKLIDRGGLVFLLGVDHRANSAIHIGEDLAGEDRHLHFSPENPKRVTVKHPQDGEIEVVLTSMMGHTVAFDQMDKVLRSRGQVVEGRIGEAECQLIKGIDVVTATVNILKRV